MLDIEQIKADREDGFEEWRALVNDFGMMHGSVSYVCVDDGFNTIAMIIARDKGRDFPFKERARRIARVPDLERAYLAAEEMAKKMKELRDEIIKRYPLECFETAQAADEALGAFRAVCDE